MLARLQQVITLSIGLGLAAWLTAQLLAGRPGLALLGAAAVLSAHALVMALEMMVMAAVNRRDRLPAATAAQVIHAWWGEVWSAPRIFCWQQPFRSRLWPDQPAGRPGQRGVVLVHGFVCNRGLWNRWLPRLQSLGIPVIAVNLEPVFGDIDDYTAAIDEAVHTLEQSTGLAPVLVAHSMGGLAVRAWLRQQGGAAAVHRIHRVITLGTPHSGTWVARFALTSNTRQMAHLGDWVQALACQETPGMLARFTCVYSNCDNIVFPTSVATLPHADNLPIEACAHVHMVDHPLPWQVLMSNLRSSDELPAVSQATFGPVPSRQTERVLGGH